MYGCVPVCVLGYTEHSRAEHSLYLDRKLYPEITHLT